MKTSKYLLLTGLAATLAAGTGTGAFDAAAQAPQTDTRQGIRDARGQTIESRIRSFGDRLELRLTAALQRADNLRARVTNRVSQFPEPVRFNKTLVDQKLKEATEAIAAGRAKVATIDAEVEKALAAANKTTAFADLRQAVREIIASVRAAHQKVVEAIRLIKSAYPPPPPTQPTQ